MIFSYILAFLMLWNGLQATPINKKAEVALEFIILHNNDMHARFEQTSVNSGPCSQKDANTDKCYGGFARVAHEVRKYREEAENGGQKVLYLNAGDTYTGTPWFTVFRDAIATAFMNKLQPDAISLGNHEFDKGVKGLVPFLNNVDFPVLAANLDLTKSPELAATKHLANHTILQVGDTKVGVIGYLTPDTEYLVSPTGVEYLNEIETINAEATALKKKGVNIIIALGHSGYQKDQEIAKNCPDVDIVIGGHSHSFLYSGDPPDAEVPVGPYPTIVKRSNGADIPVVQSYAYTKYLGKLHVQFDKDGNLIEFDGTPILLNASVPRESDVLELLETYRPTIDALGKEIVGYTKVFLDGSAAVCRKVECNLGNLIADSMIHARVLEYKGGEYWTDTAIALIGGGAVRSSIEKRSDGSITGSDLLTTLPFDNPLYVSKIYGSTLRKSLENSASKRDTDSNGGFLQMSGVHVTYDFAKEDGSKVVDVQVRCAECDVPEYHPLNDTLMYNVIVQSFLYDGGDQHILKENDTIPIVLEVNDLEALTTFLKQRTIVYPEIEGRISIVKHPSEPEDDSAAGLASSLFTIQAVLILRNLF